MSYGAGKRRKMNKFRLDELAAVDFPAQQPALAVLLKRRGEPGYDPENRDPTKRGRDDGFQKSGIFLVTSTDERHSHGLWIFPDMGGGGTTWSAWDPEDELQHDHPFSMDGEGNITIHMNAGHAHSVDSSAVARAFMVARSLDMSDKLAAMAEKVLGRNLSADARTELAKRDLALDDGSFPILERDDVGVAVKAFGRAHDRKAAALHIHRRAEALGATDLLPATGRLAALLAKEGKMSTKSTGTTDEKATLEKKIERLTKMVELTDAQKAHFEKLDDSGQDAFLALSKDERQKAVDEALAKANASDPIVYTSTDGTVFRKSDDPKMVALAKRADAADKRAQEAETQRQAEVYAKRAGTELGNLPNTETAGAALLKAIDDIEDEETRKHALEIVHAGNKAMKAAFVRRGSSDSTKAEEGGGAVAKLDALAKSHASEHNVSYHDAYAKVAEENPDLHEAAILEKNAG